MKYGRGVVSVGALCVALTVVVRADTLVMKDGQRVDGRLVTVRDGVIEFEARRGFFKTERLRVDRGDVRAIELDQDRDDRGPGRGPDGDRDREGDRDRGGRPSGLRERDVSVNAATAWNETGVEVRAGQTIYFEATGKVRWGPGRQDGPGGEGDSPRNPGRPIPGRPGAALIGRIGDSDPFFIGDDRGPIRVRESGRLFLGVNDDYLRDNSGAFRVTVYY